MAKQSSIFNFFAKSPPPVSKPKPKPSPSPTEADLPSSVEKSNSSPKEQAKQAPQQQPAKTSKAKPKSNSKPAKGGFSKLFGDKAQPVQQRDSIPNLCGEHSASQQQLAKKRRTQGPGELQRIAAEVCDTILGHAKERFSFTKHLISATLLQGDKFQQYNSQFPEAALNTTVEAYPLLNKNKLKTELSLIYSNDEFKNCSGALALYQLFMESNLQDTFSETVALLKILITTPMTTAESERCFSTLKRIKTFLRNTMSQDRLNALAMLSMEKKLIKDIHDFNHRVTEKFASLKERRAKLMYRK